MDFDLDDPLGDLLSDGSNNSFFEQLPSKSVAKSTTQADDPKSKSKIVADLFGIDAETKPAPPNVPQPSSSITANANSDLTKKPSSPKPKQRPLSSTASKPSIADTTIEPAAAAKPSAKIKFEDSDDFLNDLGFDVKNPKASLSKATAKSSILDDILNIGKSSTETRPKTPLKNTSDDIERRPSRNIATAPTASDNLSNRYSPQIGRPRTASQTNPDANSLNLFSTPTKKPELSADSGGSGRAKVKSAKKPLAVDWLGLDLEPEDSSSKQTPSTPVAAQSKPTEAIVSEIKATNLPIKASVDTPFEAKLELSKNADLFTVTTLEKEHALQSMQQQEIQLRMAAQIKQQEHVLVDMYTKQQHLIKQQETQFNELLQRQIDRQNQLEVHITKQQDQINSYINVLLSQPSVGVFGAIDSGSTVAATARVNKKSVETDEDDDLTHQLDHIELETDVKRLKLENLRLEDVLQNIRTAHEQELNLLEASHR